MKVAQNDETNPNTQCVRPPHIRRIANMQPSPSGHLSDKCPEPGKHSRMDSPFLGNVQPYVRTHPAQLIAMSFIVLPCLLCIYCFFPLFSPVDSESAADATVIDYIVEDSFSSAEQPGKPPPL